MWKRLSSDEISFGMVGICSATPQNTIGTHKIQAKPLGTMWTGYHSPTFPMQNPIELNWDTKNGEHLKTCGKHFPATKSFWEWSGFAQPLFKTHLEATKYRKNLYGPRGQLGCHSPTFPMPNPVELMRNGLQLTGTNWSQKRNLEDKTPAVLRTNS